MDALSVAAGCASMVEIWCWMVVKGRLCGRSEGQDEGAAGGRGGGRTASFSVMAAVPWNCCASNESIEWSRCGDEYESDRLERGERERERERWTHVERAEVLAVGVERLVVEVGELLGDGVDVGLRACARVSSVQRCAFARLLARHPEPPARAEPREPSRGRCSRPRRPAEPSLLPTWAVEGYSKGAGGRVEGLLGEREARGRGRGGNGEGVTERVRCKLGGSDGRGRGCC